MFSSLDWNNGSLESPLPSEDIAKTKFTLNFCTFLYKWMPFELKNASTSFQRAVHIVLSSVKWNFNLVYINDIIILRRSIEDHFGHLSTVMSLMKNAGF